MKRSLMPLGITLALLVPFTYSASAGDGTISKNWSVQFNSETGFAPSISVPPTPENASAYLVLPPCIENITNDCIVSFEATNKEGKWIKGRFKEYFPLKNLVWKDEKERSYYGDVNQIAFAKENLSTSFPAGGRTGVWEISGAEHSLGNTYALRVSFPGLLTNTPDSNGPSRTVQWTDKIYANVWPVKYDGSGIMGNGVFGSGSTFSIPSVQFGEFPLFGKFRISINFQKTKMILNDSRWFVGRLSNSKISETNMLDGSKLLSVEGSAIRIGTVQTEFEKTEASYEILKSANAKYSELTWGNSKEFNITYESFQLSSGSGYSTVDPGTLEAWRILESNFEFKYLSEESAWAIQSARISPTDRDLLLKCKIESFSPGIISTNAIAANPSPPVWDSNSQELVYTVASTHARKNGSLNVGVYELSIDERLALCLWGTNALSYRASVKVESPDGSTKVTTSTFVKRDGYLTFRAAGFGYSTSIIKVQLGNQNAELKSQTDMPDYFPDSVDLTTNPPGELVNNTPTPAAVSNPALINLVPTPTPTALNKPLIVKKTTITCTKGKLTKKVTAVNPKCPVGYKEK
jgi:hypothetical protein